MGWAIRLAPLLLGVAAINLSACYPVAFVRFAPESPARQEELTGTFELTPTLINAELTNHGTEPLLVLWHKSALVLGDDVQELIHTGGRGILAARDATGEDFTSIPAGATLRTVIYPRRSMLWTGEEWTVQSYLPIECGRSSCQIPDGLIGMILRLSLGTRQGDVEHTYEWRFRIEDITYTIRGDRQTHVAPAVIP